MAVDTQEPKSAVAGYIYKFCPRCSWRPHTPFHPSGVVSWCFYCVGKDRTALVPVPPPAPPVAKPEPTSAPPAAEAVCVRCGKGGVNPVQGKEGAVCVECWKTRGGTAAPAARPAQGDPSEGE